MINPFKKFWKEQKVEKDLGLGPTQFNPYQAQDVPIYANWANELYGGNVFGEDVVCRDGQCIPIKTFESYILGKSQEDAHREKMQKMQQE